MKVFIAKNWKDFLSEQQLDNFDAWWSLEADWFEEPNQRRGGWSGVSRIELPHSKQGKVAFFLKRQQEHTTRTWRHPLSGMLTFEREAENIHACEQAAVPALELVLFAKKIVDGKRCAVLITVALDDYAELSRPTDRRQRRAVISAVADTVRRLHDAGLQHNCLYPKHIFTRVEGEHASARLIDLEKAKHVRKKSDAVLRDLDSLNRHAEEWTNTDKLRFLLDYTRSEKVNDKVRTLWCALVTLAKRKQQKRA